MVRGESSPPLHARYLKRKTFDNTRAASANSEPVNPPAPAPGGAKSAGRIDAVDWLRGLAVVLMIQTHLYGCWSSPAAQATALFLDRGAWAASRSGCSCCWRACRWRSSSRRQLARGVERSAMVRGGVRRGFEVLVLAYLFRLQEYVLGLLLGLARPLSRRHPELHRRVDDAGGVDRRAAPRAAADTRSRWRRGGRSSRWGRSSGRHHFPRGCRGPSPRTSAGQRPMAWFPLFPSLAWPLVGVADRALLGARRAATPRRQAMAFVITRRRRLAMVGAVMLVRHIDPYIIRYPSEIVQQMGPGTFFHRLGSIGTMALPRTWSRGSGRGGGSR